MNTQARITALEAAIGTQPDRCPACGADWVGSTFACVEADGRRRHACIRCLGDRPAPDYRPRGNHRWMIEGLQP